MMNIKEIKNELLNEKYYDIDHPSGLKILVMPKENYASSYAIFATKYGSIDTMIQMQDGSFKEIPEGTAHFLEHKLLKARISTLLNALPKPELRQTPTQALTEPDIFFRAPQISKRILKFSLILFRIPILLKRQSRRSRALSVRKSTCTRMFPTGRSCSTA